MDFLRHQALILNLKSKNWNWGIEIKASAKCSNWQGQNFEIFSKLIGTNDSFSKIEGSIDPLYPSTLGPGNRSKPITKPDKH